MINLQGHETRALLNHRLASTGCINQFSYHELDDPAGIQGKPVTALKDRVPGGEEDFDSLWHTL